MTPAHVYTKEEPEALRYMWIESEKAGQGEADEALRAWVRRHWWGLLRCRWVEHLQGKRFWVELDRSDFGMLLRQFHDSTLLLDRILDRIKSGQGNLGVIGWAIDWGMPMRLTLEMLEALDVHSRRLAHRFDPLDVPRVTIDPGWLIWEGGIIVHLARGIDAEDAFDRLPILGDALEEAGCTDPVILDHCRAGGYRRSWSWLVERILGR
jgi:hypothetical protein